jgi:hypothetical protein
LQHAFDEESKARASARGGLRSLDDHTEVSSGLVVTASAALGVSRRLIFRLVAKECAQVSILYDLVHCNIRITEGTRENLRSLARRRLTIE